MVENLEVPGFPEGYELFPLEDFKGVNTKANRPGIQDQEFSWLENWFPIGPQNLRTIYGQGDSVYTATSGKTIISHYFYNIVSTQYAIVFLNDGTAKQINLSTLVATDVSATTNLFYNNSDIPVAVQYGASGILILGTASSNCYFAWDGSTLYNPGDFAPSWLSGTSNITPIGNTNSNTTINNLSSTTGIVAGMTVSGTGIPSGTTVASIDTTTSITISQAATSSSSGISFIFQWAMPTGIRGSAIETYFNYVWITYKSTLFFSAPSNGTLFSTLGGGSLISKDSFLKIQYTQVKQSNGFLYLIGDSSINSISGVVTSGSPSSTTFSNLNVDPQVGTPWKASVVQYGRGIVLANTSGIYILFGGAAEKISSPLDGFFSKSFLPLTGASLPSCGVATIFGIKVYIILIPGAVDYLGVSRPIMAMWDGNKWFLSSQESSLTYISFQENQSELTAWGTDGKSLFPLFQKESLSLQKIAQSKLWAGNSYIINKQALRVYLQIQDNYGSGATMNVEVDTEQSAISTSFSSSNSLIFINNSGDSIQFVNNSSQSINFTVPADSILANNVDIYGQLLGLGVTTYAQDATLISISLGYRNYRGLY